MFLRLFFQALISFLVLDFFWINYIASPQMKKLVPHLLVSTPNFLAAGAFYLIYLTALVYLIILPNLHAPLRDLLLRSFVFGFVAYATYDLTNLAILKDFPLNLAIADMVWGGLLTLMTAYLATRFLG